MFRILSPLTRVLGRRLNLSLGTALAFVAVNLLLVAACFLALQQNMKLRRKMANEVALLTPGRVVPPLAGRDWTGTLQNIVFEQDERPTLVYTFSKQCPHCQKNWHAMRSLQALAPRWLRIVYVDTSGSGTFTPEYLAENGIGQSVLLVKLTSPAGALVYDAPRVPQVVLVDHDGRVQWSHVGELASSDISKALSLVEHD